MYRLWICSVCAHRNTEDERSCVHCRKPYLALYDSMISLCAPDPFVNERHPWVGDCEVSLEVNADCAALYCRAPGSTAVNCGVFGFRHDFLAELTRFRQRHT